MFLSLLIFFFPGDFLSCFVVKDSGIYSAELSEQIFKYSGRIHVSGAMQNLKMAREILCF